MRQAGEVFAGEEDTPEAATSLACLCYYL